MITSTVYGDLQGSRAWRAEYIYIIYVHTIPRLKLQGI